MVTISSPESVAGLTFGKVFNPYTRTSAITHTPLRSLHVRGWEHESESAYKVVTLQWRPTVRIIKSYKVQNKKTTRQKKFRYKRRMKIKGPDQRVSQKSCDRLKERINVYNKKAWDVFSRISLPIQFGTNLYLSISKFSCQLSWLFWTKLCGKNMCLKSFTLC